MRSPAADIHRLTDRALEALDADRMEDLDEAVERLAKIGHPENAGSVEEIEAALLATRKLYEAVEREAARVADEIAHVQAGKRALDHYEGPKEKAPRALYLSA